MSKRFTATEKWERPWFRGLPEKYRMFWLYICDKCDISGVWYVDIPQASFSIGSEISAEEAKEMLKKQILQLNGGSKWLLLDFIPFQYGKLSENSRFHASIVDTLVKHGVPKKVITGYQTGCRQGITSSPQAVREPVDRPKDKDKDKEEEKDIVFNELWNKYPKKLGRTEAYKHFKASVKTDQDILDINTALDNYNANLPTDVQYIKHGSTWFNQWRDWVQYEGPTDLKAKFAEITRLNKIGGV